MEYNIFYGVILYISCIQCESNVLNHAVNCHGKLFIPETLKYLFEVFQAVDKRVNRIIFFAFCCIIKCKERHYKEFCLLWESQIPQNHHNLYLIFYRLIQLFITEFFILKLNPFHPAIK
jgi:hypothetical protein